MGAVVGAGAVVTKDIEPYSVVAGIPAKNTLNTDLKKILEISWWNLNGGIWRKKITKLALCFNNPEFF